MNKDKNIDVCLDILNSVASTLIFWFLFQWMLFLMYDRLVFCKMEDGYFQVIQFSVKILQDTLYKYTLFIIYIERLLQS